MNNGLDTYELTDPLGSRRTQRRFGIAPHNSALVLLNTDAVQRLLEQLS